MQNNGNPPDKPANPGGTNPDDAPDQDLEEFTQAVETAANALDAADEALTKIVQIYPESSAGSQKKWRPHIIKKGIRGAEMIKQGGDLFNGIGFTGDQLFRHTLHTEKVAIIKSKVDGLAAKVNGLNNNVRGGLVDRLDKLDNAVEYTKGNPLTPDPTKERMVKISGPYTEVETDYTKGVLAKRATNAGLKAENEPALAAEQDENQRLVMENEVLRGGSISTAAPAPAGSTATKGRGPKSRRTKGTSTVGNPAKPKKQRKPSKKKQP